MYYIILDLKEWIGKGAFWWHSVHAHLLTPIGNIQLEKCSLLWQFHCFCEANANQNHHQHWCAWDEPAVNIETFTVTIDGEWGEVYMGMMLGWVRVVCRGYPGAGWFTLILLRSNSINFVHTRTRTRQYTGQLISWRYSKQHITQPCNIKSSHYLPTNTKKSNAHTNQQNNIKSPHCAWAMTSISTESTSLSCTCIHSPKRLQHQP